MFTPVFDKVDGSTFTLGDITVCNAEGVPFVDDSITGATQCRKLSVTKLNDSKLTITGMKGYTTKKGAFWGTFANTELTSGEGVIVYNNNGFDIKFQVSGSVVLKPITDIIPGYSVWGNNTPINYTLGDITVCNADGVPFVDDSITGATQCRKLSVTKLNANKLTITGMKGYTTKKGAFWGTFADIPLNAGEALIVYNNNGFPLKFKLPEIKTDAK